MAATISGDVWIGLMANMAVITAVICIWNSVKPHRLFPPRTVSLFLGVLSGLAIITVITFHIEVVPGVLIDLRIAMMALASYFGGPMTAIVAAAIAVPYRLSLGGDGAIAGSLSTIMPVFVALLFRRLAGPSAFSWGGLLAMSGMTSSVGVSAFFFLPNGQWVDVLPVIGLPLATVNFAACFLGGMLLRTEMRRRESEIVNLVYRQAIEALPDCLNVKDTDGRFIIANAATARLMLANDADDLIGKTDSDFYPPDIASGFLDDERAIMTSGVAKIIDQKAIRRDGTSVLLSTLKVPLHNHLGEIAGILSHNRDVTEKRGLEQALARSQQHLADAIAHMPGGLAMFDHQGILLFCNDQYREIFPKTAHLRVPGVSYREIYQAAIAQNEILAFPESTEEDLQLPANELLRTCDNMQCQLADGRWMESRVRYTLGGACFLMVADISGLKAKEKSLAEINNQLAIAAATDGLTGLANRRAFDDALNRELARAREGRGTLSLMLIDVDRFKLYNDTYGHPAGDECLRKVAAEIRAIAKTESCFAARYGGEEMALILPNTTKIDAVALAHRVGKAVRDLAILHAGSEKGVVTLSLGVSAYDPRHDPPLATGDMLKRADEALYWAKSDGRDAVRSFQLPASMPARRRRA